MSTKIYEAYEYKGGDVESLFRGLRNLRKRVWDRTIPYLAAQIQDPKEWNMIAWSDDFREVLRSSQAFATGKRGNFIENPSCSSVVYLRKGRIFVQFFGVMRYMGPLRIKGLVDYHYQNQCDPWYDDEEYRAKKAGKTKGKAWLKEQAANYRERKRTWDAILGESGVPSIAGLSYELITDSDHFIMATRVFEKLHGHRAYPGPGDEANKTCPICIYRRAQWEKEEAEKREKAAKAEDKAS